MILLDTHVLVRLLSGDPKLGKRARVTIDRAGRRDEVFVSAISFWEIAMLVARHVRFRRGYLVGGLRIRGAARDHPALVGARDFARCQLGLFTFSISKQDSSFVDGHYHQCARRCSQGELLVELHRF